MGSGRIGLIGLGNAGSAIASAFSNEHVLMGYDINIRRKEHLLVSGHKWAGSVAEVANKVDVVMISLPTLEASKSVIVELLNYEKRPKIIIETSTIAPSSARHFGELCETNNIEFIDAAIGSGVQAIANREITFLVGGSKQAVAKARPVLEVISKKIYHLGPIGAGSGAKVINNAVMHSLMVVLIEAGAMARKLDISISSLTEILGGDDGVSRPLNHRLNERILNDDYDGGMSVINAHKDSVLALETARDCDVPLFAIAASHEPYEIAKEEGLGEQDYAVLAKLWERWGAFKFRED